MHFVGSTLAHELRYFVDVFGEVGEDVAFEELEI
jgi:hypothetical protein